MFVDWAAVEQAFRVFKPDEACYLDRASGGVVRVALEPASPSESDLRARVETDPGRYLSLPGLGMSERRSWMEQFALLQSDASLVGRLQLSLAGNNGGRRFGRLLEQEPLLGVRWQEFEQARVRATVRAWLTEHAIVPDDEPGAPPRR